MNTTDAPIIIPTLLHEHGPTGVHAHFNSFRKYLERQGRAARVVTPFDVRRVLAYPMFGVRYAFDRLHGGASVWWYNHWHYVFLKQALRQLLRDGKPAVIYAQCPISAKAALDARNRSTQRVVLVVHFNVSQANEWAERGKISFDDAVFRGIQQLEQTVMPRVDGIVYVSRFMQEQLRARIPGIERVEAAVIPNFVSPPAGEAGDVSGDLINIGTLEPRKNQRYLIDVLAHAKQMGHRYTLTLVGGGRSRGMLEQLVREKDIADQVRFLGNQSNAARFIKNHRVYVHSATMESFGIVLIEALAAGKPVVAGAVGGVPEVYSEGKEGIFWPLNDPAEGARRLVELMQQPDRVNQMAIAAQERYRDAFTPEIAASRLLEFICSSRAQEKVAV